MLQSMYLNPMFCILHKGTNVDVALIYSIVGLTNVQNVQMLTNLNGH